MTIVSRVLPGWVGVVGRAGEVSSKHPILSDVSVKIYVKCTIVLTLCNFVMLIFNPFLIPNILAFHALCKKNGSIIGQSLMPMQCPEIFSTCQDLHQVKKNPN